MAIGWGALVYQEMLMEWETVNIAQHQLWRKLRQASGRLDAGVKEAVNGYLMPFC